MKRTTTTSPVFVLFFISFLSLFSIKAWAQLLIPNTSPITESMNGMGNSGAATLPTGFVVSSATTYSGGATTTDFAAGTSGAGALTGGSTGGTYNFANGATASSTDRALGFLTTGSFSSPRSIMLEVQNTTGLYITSITMVYKIEKYRSGTRAFDWTFFSGTNGSTWTAQTAGDQSYGADANNTTVFDPPSFFVKTVPITGLNIAPNAKYYFRWTHTGSGGSTNGQALGLDSMVITASTTDPLILTSVTSLSAFANTEVGSSSVQNSYTVGATNLIADLVVSAPAHYQVSRTSGTNFQDTIHLTPTAGTVTAGTFVYVRMHPTSIGTKTGNVTNASTGAVTKNVSVTGFADAQPVCAYGDDFTDNNFTVNPAWSGNTSDFSVIATNPINTTVSTDGAFLAANTTGHFTLTTPSTITDEWRFSLASTNFNPSDNNYFGIILMADRPLKNNMIDSTWLGYYLRIGNDGTTDPIRLYRKTGSGQVQVGTGFPLSPNFEANALKDGLNLRVTRSGTGQFEVFYSTGFLNEVVPTNTAGTLTDNTTTTSNYFGVFQRFTTSGYMVYFDNFCTFERTFTWLPTTGTTSWITTTNWSPPRTSPAVTDILLFNQGSSSIATNIPTTETVKQFIVSNSSQISLRSATLSGSALTITGSTGDDFVVGSGSKLIFDSNPGSGTGFPVTITVAPKATGSVSGNITFDKTSGNQPDHRLLTDKSSPDSSTVTFNSGAVFHAKDCSGNPFDATVPRVSHIFANGSTYIKEAGNNPFGFGQPESKVVFQSGSTYIHKSGIPAFAGRTYGNFELDAGTLTIASGSTASCTVENFTITNGTLNFPLATNDVRQNFDVKGDLSVAPGATFNYSPTNIAAASTFNFIGPNSGISNTGSITFGANATVEINSNITLSGNTNPLINGTLSRKTGLVLAAGGGGSFAFGSASVLNYNGTTSLNASLELPNTGAVSSASPPTINVNISGQTLTIISAKEVRGVMNVKAGSTVNANGLLTFQSGASLLHGAGTPGGNTGTVSGNIIAKRTGSSATFNYNYWSSPVAGASTAVLGNHQYYYEPDSAKGFGEQELRAGWIPASGATMTAGKGYIATGGGTVSFTGASHNGSYNVAVRVNDNNSVAYNLTGNPYPCAVSATDFLNANATGGTPVIKGTLYFWDDDGTNGSAWTTADYASWNLTGGIGLGSMGGGGGATPNGSIGSGQSFFVDANIDGNVSYTNSMRRDTNSQFFRLMPIERLWISVTNSNQYYNESLIGFIDDATDGVDNLYDGKKFRGSSQIALYSKLNGDDYAIQAFPLLTADRVVSMGLDAGSPGTYTLKLKEVENLDNTVVIFLEDAVAGVMQNLRMIPEYSVILAAGKYNQRFFLHFNPAMEISTMEATCSGNDGQIILEQPGSMVWNYTLTNAQGQLVNASANFNGIATINNLPQDVYTLTLTDISGYQVVKTINVDAKIPVEALFEADKEYADVNEPVSFTSLSTGATQYEWDFGDGMFITGTQNPSHAYTLPGIYDVTLRALNNDCEDEFYQTLTILGPTGIQNSGDDKVDIYGFGERILIKFDFAKVRDARITVYNILGAELYNSDVTTTGQHEIIFTSQPANQYIVRVQTAETSFVNKVLLAN